MKELNLVNTAVLDSLTSNMIKPDPLQFWMSWKM